MGRISQAWPALAPPGALARLRLLHPRAFGRSFALNQIPIQTPFLACTRAEVRFWAARDSCRRNALNLIAKYPTVSTLVIAVAIVAVSIGVFMSIMPPPPLR
ncbi:MAG: hypothetical protein IT539_14365 [Bradyrhizobiaceae bacterium]|nr:hypothetical protein [Bradyrhizobiaceae bacterium]